MSTTSDKDPVVDEKAWLAWVAKGKRQDQDTARKTRMFVGTALVLLVIGFVYFFKSL